MKNVNVTPSETFLAILLLLLEFIILSSSIELLETQT